VADISDIQAAGTIKIVGSDSTGVEQAPVQSTASGSLHSNLRNNAGTEIGTAAAPLRVDPTGATAQPISFPSEGVNSFGNLKVANSHSVFESVFNFDKQPFVWSEALATGGTNTWNANTNSLNLVTTTSSGSSVIVQSKKRMRYNPARSVLIQISGNSGALLANNRVRIGQFDANNGLFFQNTNVASVVVRSNTSGSVVDTVVEQSSWNLNKLDGTGAGGLTVDFSKHQLFVIEYGWQGIAAIKFGFYINGRIVHCHQVDSSNALTVPYMKTANLPIRVENTNTGAVASTKTVTVTCVSVKHYGEDQDAEGMSRAFVLPTVKTVAAMPTFTPIISMRLSAASIAGIVELLKAPVYGQTADDVVWKIILNPTLTGSTFATTIGLMQIDNAATALSGGTDIVSGFIKQGGDSGLDSLENFKLINTFFGATQAGVADIITIAAASRTTTADIWGSITWREF
jgi:hypothetical protein